MKKYTSKKVPTKPISIKVLNKFGTVIGRYESIHKYRKEFGCARFASTQLTKLKKNGIVKIGDDYILKSQTSNILVKKIISTEASILKRKMKAEQVEKINSLRIGAKNSIVVVDHNFKIVSVETNSTQKEISERYNLSEGTIKSSLSRFKRDKAQFINGKKLAGLKSGYRFIYLKELL
jgi:hypothetical protein